MNNISKKEKDFDGITLDDLQEQHQQYAEIIGVTNLILLSEEFGGSSIYIPKMDKLFKNQKYAKIMQEYNGNNIKRLMAKYRVSQSTVYRLVRSKQKAIKRRPLEGQLTLF